MVTSDQRRSPVGAGDPPWCVHVDVGRASSRMAMRQVLPAVVEGEP
jgi:hypothetical protein